MAKALVTGGAGFMGSHLVDQLIDQMDMQVTVLDDLSGGFVENLHPNANFVQGSITDHALVNSLFAQSHFNYVYHLAAYAAEGLSHFIKRFNYQNNLIGSVNLINASVNHQVQCFVFTSSIAVYGKNQVPMVETLVPMPEDPYGIAKLAVEQELRVTKDLFGLDYVVFRPHNVYGPRQNLGDKYRNVVGIFMNRLMQGQELIIFGDGKQERAFTYIQDIIPAIARSVDLHQAMNQIFNIGSDQVFSVNQLADLVIQAMDLPGRIRHVDPRMEVQKAYSDHRKFQQVFPSEKHTPLELGLREMAAWAKQGNIRSSKDFLGIEITKNLPKAWV